MRYGEGAQGFSEEALREATYGREVIDCQYEFFTYGQVPHVSLILKLADVDGVSSSTKQFLRKDSGENPEDMMNDDQKRVYRELRRWRNDATKARGLPTYAFGRNALLAEIVRIAPKTIAALKEISGIGDKFCKEHGKTILTIVGNLEPDDGKMKPMLESAADKKEDKTDEDEKNGEEKDSAPQEAKAAAPTAAPKPTPAPTSAPKPTAIPASKPKTQIKAPASTDAEEQGRLL